MKLLSIYKSTTAKAVVTTTELMTALTPGAALTSNDVAEK